MNKIAFILTLLMPFTAFSQTQMVLNGAYVNITNNAFLVIENNQTNAIVRNSGHILSAGENNVVKWNIGTSTGSYTVPFGDGTSDYIPLTLEPDAAVGAGHFLFATVNTPTWQNSISLPTGISNMDFAAADRSEFTIDRFWRVEAQNYTTKPNVNGLTFTYIDAEHSVASNTILETALQAVRYNPVLSQWDDIAPLGLTNPTANTVYTGAFTEADFYPWWSLYSDPISLSINYIKFNANCSDNRVALEWISSAQQDIIEIVVEYSNSGVDFESIASLPANETGHYQYTHEQTNGERFYRIKEKHSNGSVSYSANIKADCFSNRITPKLFYFENKIYLEYLSDEEQRLNLYLYDIAGKAVLYEMFQLPRGMAHLELPTNGLAKGVYAATMLVNGEWRSEKVIIN